MAAAIPAAAPADPQALIALAGSLTALLERETAMVRAMDVAAIAPLQAEKQRLTLMFQQAIKSPAGAATASLKGPAKAAWLAAIRQLSAAAMDNERALRVGRAATERLIAAVVTAVKQSRRIMTGYSARRVARTGRPVAGVACDRRL
jgi:hypothetical protein